MVRSQFNKFEQGHDTKREGVPRAGGVQSGSILAPSQKAHEHAETVWEFGQRIRGRTFGEANLWLPIANFIATMDIGQATKEDGSLMIPAAAKFGFGGTR